MIILTGSVKTERLTDNYGNTTAPVEPISVSEVDEGSYHVGEFMEPGIYTLTAKDGFGRVTVSADENKDSVSISRSFSKETVINAVKDQWVSFAGATAKKIDYDQEKDFTTEGTFVAGVQFKPGTYSIVADNGRGWFCVYKDADQNAISTEGPVKGTAIVSVYEGQILELTSCHFRDVPDAPDKVYTDKEIVKKVQVLLTAAGFDCGTPDGIVGANGLGSITEINDTLLQSLGVQI